MMENRRTEHYVNLTDLKQIAVINRKPGRLRGWPMTLEHEFSDGAGRSGSLVFVANATSRRAWPFLIRIGGPHRAEFPCVQDADDVYYDSGRKRIYIPGGEGYISVFQQTSQGAVEQ